MDKNNYNLSYNHSQGNCSSNSIDKRTGVCIVLLY